MKIVDSLLRIIKKKQQTNQEDVPDGYCPNCWGTQEYGGQFFEAVKNNNLDINSKNPDVGWVQDYANKYLLGIELKQEGDKYVCLNCKLKYRPT